MSDEKNDLERRSAQAMLAMFVQVSSSVELARHVQRARERSLERRMSAARDAGQIARIQQRLDAQQSQGATIELVSERMRGQAANVAKFAAAGLDLDDFRRLGVHHIVDEAELTAEIAKHANKSE